MGFKLEVEGQESFTLGPKVVTNVVFGVNTPNDSNARSTDMGTEAKVYGKILTMLDGDPEDGTKKLGLWALVPAEDAKSYRKVTITADSAEQVIRTVTLPNAFVIGYTETFTDDESIGQFCLHVRQKKDRTDQFTVNGNYAASE